MYFFFNVFFCLLTQYYQLVAREHKSSSKALRFANLFSKLQTQVNKKTNFFFICCNNIQDYNFYCITLGNCNEKMGNIIFFVIIK